MRIWELPGSQVARTQCFSLPRFNPWSRNQYATRQVASPTPPKKKMRLIDGILGDDIKHINICITEISEGDKR